MKSFYLASLALGLGLSLAGVVRAQNGPYGSPSVLPQANYPYPNTQTSGFAPQGQPPQNWNGYYPQPPAYPGNPGNTGNPGYAPGPGYPGYPGMAQGPAYPGPISGNQFEVMPPAQGVPAYGQGNSVLNNSPANSPVGNSLFGNSPAGGSSMCADGSCGNWSGCGQAGYGTSGWFAGAAGLIMTRNNANPYYFSYFDSNEAAQLLRPTNLWGGGAEAWVGKWFGCGCGGWGGIGVQAVYWGLYPGVAQTSVLNTDMPGNLNGILNFDQLNYNGGPANLSTDAALIHRLQTQYQVHNAELNLLGGMMASVGPVPVRLTWLTGFRYFRFQDTLQFASDPTDYQFTGAAPELYYDVRAYNNLYGWQVGGLGNFFIAPRLSLNLGSKFGIFGNAIDSFQRIGGSAGDAVVNNGPFNGQAFNIHSTTQTVSFLGELNAGLGYWVTNNWQITAGYRAVAVSGLALTTNQIPSDLRGLNDVRAIDTNGSLILHGGYAGAQFIW